MPEHGIITGLREALAFAGGEDIGARVTVVNVPKSVDVREIRQRLKLTQPEFAVKFGFAVATLRNWEQKRRAPSGSDRVLLTLIDRAPEMVQRVLAGTELA